MRVLMLLVAMGIVLMMLVAMPSAFRVVERECHQPSSKCPVKHTVCKSCYLNKYNVHSCARIGQCDAHHYDLNKNPYDGCESPTSE